MVSTGKSDWPHDHTEDETGLSHHLNRALLESEGITPGPPPPKDQAKKDQGQKGDKPAPPPPAPVQDPSKQPGQVDLVVGKNGLPQGIYETLATPEGPAESSASSIPKQPGTMLFSSSLVSQSHEGHRETVLSIPDWKVVVDVTNDIEGARGVLTDLVAHPEGEDHGGRRTWTLPYRAVVLLCESIALEGDLSLTTLQAHTNAETRGATSPLPSWKRLWFTPSSNIKSPST